MQAYNLSFGSATYCTAYVKLPALLDVFHDAGANNRDIRKTLRRAARLYLRESRPKWVDRLMFDLFGAAVIFGGVYGIAAVINWLSEVIL